MRINVLKNKYLRSGLFIIFGSILSSLYMNNTSYASKAVPYYFEGTSSEYSGFIDPDVPPAIKLTQAVDGMPKGTILYKTQYLDFTYYCPVTPKELQGTSKEVNPTKYRKWGPWDMPANKVAYEETVSGITKPGFIPSSYIYTSVTIPKGTSVQGIKVDNNGKDYRTTLGKLTSQYKGKVKSVTNYKGRNDPHIYFDLSKTNLKGKGAVNVGRVPVSKATVSGKTNLYYSDSRAIYTRFPKYGIYSDSSTKKTNTLTDASHQNIEKGKWVNPSYAPYGLAGLSGEWFKLGYNADGDVLENPYYISTSLYFRGNSDLKDYDFRYTPWNKSDSNGESESNKTDAYNNFSKPTKYDTQSKYYNDKYKVVKKLFDDGVLTRKKSTLDADIKDMLNRISFRNHPVNEATLLEVQRRSSSSTRTFTVFNELSDIYLHSISVTDSSGKEVASYSYDINTKKVTRKDGSGIVAGQKYTVKVYLGNTRNRDIIATKNQTQIGIKSNYKAYSSLPISATTSTQSKEVANTMKATKGSKSSAMTFTITAPNADFFDIYGYVGYKHLGTDNLDESNDIGRVRMNINGTNYSEQYDYGYADLEANKIELLNSSGNVVYSYSRGASSPSIANAVMPGETYSIRYTIVNKGDDAKYRVKSKGYWSGDNWIPGSWGAWQYYDSNVNSKYQYTRIGSGEHTSSNDVIPPLQTFTVSNEIPVALNGNTTFKVYKGTQITYTVRNVVFENPYLETSFSFTANDDHVNCNTENDSLSVTIRPLYDAVISNVRIQPKYEYINNETKKTSYLIIYDAKLDVPDFMKNSNVQMKIETAINVGGKTEIFTDFLTIGENKNLSHSIDNLPISSAGTITATVILNYHKHTYETNYNNNKDSASGSSIIKVNNPFNGQNSDIVKGTDTSNGSTASGGGSLNNNCLIPRTTNNWNVTHRKVTWNATQKSYTTVDGVTKSFTSYKTASDTTLNPINYRESYNIDAILFRSKDTIDKGLGNNGWINLTNNSNLATIKAGYGFELKVITKYRTNANKIMPYNTTASNGLSGTFYSNSSRDAGINLSKDIFIELPGSRSTRKILSTTGYEGTTKGVIVTEADKSTSSETIKEFTYTIKATNTLGIKASNKIFIPASLKDGEYKISIYTPPVTGVPSANKGTYSALCDRKDVTIKVKGSYTDDLNSHITQ